jgi:hypothetical protein
MYDVQIASDGMIYIPSFVALGSGIQIILWILSRDGVTIDGVWIGNRIY